MHQLSENFWLHEFLFSKKALQHGIKNTPTAKVIDNLTWLCRTILQPTRNQWGAIKIESGFRVYELNKLVGGVYDSDHMLGLAADIVPLEAHPQDVFIWLIENINFKEAIDQIETKGSIHVSSYQPEIRSILYLDKNGKYQNHKIPAV